MKNLLRVCLIGSGNLATHLGAALRHSGIPVVCVYSRNAEHAKVLAERLGNIQCTCRLPDEQAETVMYTDELALLPEADVYIFSVKDDALPDLVERVAQMTKERASSPLFVHTAGSVPLSVLTRCAAKAAVLYPMQTFSKVRTVSFSEIPIFIEGSDPTALHIVRLLAERISSNVTELDSERRKRLHLAAVFACNFTNHCYTLAGELLHEAGVSPRCLLPLIDETARKVHDLSPLEAQTGPAVRWDEEVIARHLSELASQPEMQAIYQLMSQSIHQHHDTL